jgi:hypothetical protein
MDHPNMIVSRSLFRPVHTDNLFTVLFLPKLYVGFDQQETRKHNTIVSYIWLDLDYLYATPVITDSQRFTHVRMTTQSIVLNYISYNIN